jgi:DNA polymerase
METLRNIASKVVVCKLCDLALKRTNAVPGDGIPSSRLFILGEAPGRYEDLRGHPFVGMSGKFLNKYLAYAEIKREEAFVTNAVKCRPPNNKKPRQDELLACRPYLVGQLSVIKPKLVLALGTSAASAIGIKFEHLSEVRGRLLDVELDSLKLKVFVTFHPSFPMRFKKPRETFLGDLRIVGDLLKDK